MTELLKRRRPYNPEVEYFWRTNRALIEKRRRVRRTLLNEMEARETLEFSRMRCPECGYRLVESDFDGVRASKCEKCDGVYLGTDELSHLMQKQKPSGFFTGLASIFH